MYCFTLRRVDSSLQG